MTYQLCYIFHSGLALLFTDMTVIMDYYEDSSAGSKGVLHADLLKRNVPLYVLSSHFHHDHYNPEIFTFPERPTTYILSSDIYKQRRHTLPEQRKLHFLSKGQYFDDGRLRVEAYGSTDAGSSFAISRQDQTFFHAGDLNNWHWMERRGPEEWHNAERSFLSEVEQIRQTHSHFDLIMFPVDPRLGHEYQRGAAQFIERITCRYFCPMHFDLAYDKADAFVQYTKARNITLLQIQYRGQYFTLD